MSKLTLCIGLTLICLFCVEILSFTHHHNQRINDLLVNTNYGYVLGSLGYSRNSREFASFRGIPYAQPPVGDLRFQNPLPPNLWNSPYNATVDGPTCIQLVSSLTSDEIIIGGQEDCLYLNIYVPFTEDGDSSALLPVMVFIPGGGFVQGGAASNMYGPQYLMDKDVILVTLNYRLGPFGFLSTLDDEAPGNFGLKDQVMALRFVNENIENFGGDKERVTLFGESAGGASVGLQLISPLSDGLFQQAIGQSGAALSSWALDNNELQLNTTNVLASFVGCQDFIGNSQRLVECFRSVDAETLVGTLFKFQVFLNSPVSPYRTVIELRTDRNPEPFLEDSPLEYVRGGDFKHIPFITGTNQDEGILAAGPFIKVQQIQDAFNTDFDAILPELLYFKSGYEEDTEGLLQNITEFYLGGDHFVNASDPTKIQGFIDMVTDRMFLYSTEEVIITQYLAGQDPIWVYNFAYRGNLSTNDLSGPSNVDFNWGVSHGDDGQYLFSSEFFAPLGQHGADLQMSEDLVELWTNFVIFGDPDPSGGFSWKKLDFGLGVTFETLNYLNISGSFISESVQFEMEQGYNVGRMQFWAQQNLRENS